jgi:hypothetical protein
VSGEAVLGPRALNRALLARQHLLERAEGVSARAAVEHLAGLQAQAPLPPYLALWSRLEGFDPHELGRMLTEREVVRLSLMRGTVHLVTVDDALWLRPLAQVVLERGHKGVYGRRMGGAEPAEIEAVTRELLAGEQLGGREVARRLIERGIGDDEEALTNAVRVYAPVVQLPPRGVWRAGGPPKYATLEDWTGRDLAAEPSLEDLVVRYLAAFGPASVMDAQTWSGLTKLRRVFEGLRDRLATFRDEAGKELFDLPEAPRPDPGVPAPARFLGEFDNVLLSHADRSRVIPPGFPWRALLDAPRAVSHLLVDGMLRGTWWIDRDGLAISAVPPLAGSEREEVGSEAERVLAFVAEDAQDRGIRFVEAGPAQD